MKTNTKLRACAYVRVSTSQQVAEGESLTTQRKQVQVFIEQRD